MYVDSQLELSVDQGITATAISSNVIDLSSVVAGAGSSVSPNSLQDIGQGEDLYLIVQAHTAANGADAAKTLTITLETDTAVGLGSSTVVVGTGAITGANITAGAYLMALKLPSFDYKRYIGLRYTVSAGFTSFNVSAFITKDLQKNKIYKSGFTVQ